MDGERAVTLYRGGGGGMGGGGARGRIIFQVQLKTKVVIKALDFSSHFSFLSFPWYLKSSLFLPLSYHLTNDTNGVSNKSGCLARGCPNHTIRNRRLHYAMLAR